MVLDGLTAVTRHGNAFLAAVEGDGPLGVVVTVASHETRMAR